jgi:Ca-activated chloride channel family protein
VLNLRALRGTLAAAGIGAAAALMALLPGGARVAQAASSEGRTTPGCLTIIDDKGQATGLCPLKHTSVTADVSGFVARVTVKQEFGNPSRTPVEAIYTFPLPGDAAVDDMTMTVGKRVIKGEIKRREEARQIYETARAQGQVAALLDQERPNIFTQSVANIMPGEKVVISISYVNLLKYDDGKYEFNFPMVVGPRFVPQGGYTVPGKRGDPAPKDRPGPNPRPVPVGKAANTGVVPPGRVPANTGPTKAVVTDPEKITPPITPPGTRAGHDIDLTVNLDAGVTLRGIESVLHQVNIRRDGDTAATISLADAKTIPNKDFILRFSVAGENLESGLLTHRDPKGPGYFTLILQPPAAPPQERISAKEMVFVIDQTGSQSGWPIAKGKEVMRHCIDSLNPGDTFQLIGFNTEVYPCFPQPVEANARTIRQAQEFLKPIEGSGGTDILKSIEYALKIPDDPSRLRIICYLTDGYVGNDMQILDFIGKNRGRARVFPIGIGNGVNRFLIDGMAREGRGVADYVTLEEDGRQAAKRFYERIASPLLLDVSIDWGRLPVDEVYPRHIPDVFTAAPIIVKGRYAHAAEGDITIRGVVRGRPWKQVLRVNLPEKTSDGEAIPTMWARERIEDLQSRDWMGAQTGRPDPAIKEDIINTALEFRLMSQYTSFVAVEQKVVNISGELKTVDVPVEMPEGVSYEGIFGDAAKVKESALSLSRTRAKTLYGAPARPSVGATLGMSGGFGGAPVAAAKPASPGTPAQGVVGALPGVALAEEPLALADSSPSWDESAIRRNDKGVMDAIAKLAPEARLAALRRAKLDPALIGLADKVKAEGTNDSLKKAGLPEVEKGRVTVQVWLNSMPADALTKLKAAGFTLAATLQPKRLLLGSIDVGKLDALVELGFVARVEPPSMK